MARESVTAGVERASSASWVVEMEKLLEDTKPSVEMARWKQRSIYRVPEFMKKMTNRDAYQPQFVSLGPLHHGEPHLLPMEEHKRRAVLHMVKWAGKPLTEFIAAIEEAADELEAAYNDLDDRWRGVNRRRFVEMISRSSFLNLWPIMRNDMIAMEDQIPLLVLQRILFVSWSGTPPSAREINNAVQSLLVVPPFEEGVDELGLHFLDILHKSYRGITPHWEGSDKYERRTPSAVELSEAGIQFKKSNSESIHDVGFENGVLSMPLFIFHDQTEMEILNLMAFEWLHCEDKYVSSYISFVDKITESERDVALLRSKGLFENMIGSDKAVVKMFDTLTKLARTPRPGSRLGHVQWKLNAHCNKRRNKWRAMFVNNYLNNPWVFISLVAAVILLIATIMQTIYTIVPFYTKG